MMRYSVGGSWGNKSRRGWNVWRRVKLRSESSVQVGRLESVQSDCIMTVSYIQGEVLWIIVFDNFKGVVIQWLQRLPNSIMSDIDMSAWGEVIMYVDVSWCLFVYWYYCLELLHGWLKMSDIIVRDQVSGEKGQYWKTHWAGIGLYRRLTQQCCTWDLSSEMPGFPGELEAVLPPSVMARLSLQHSFELFMKPFDQAVGAGLVS